MGVAVIERRMISENGNMDIGGFIRELVVH